MNTLCSSSTHLIGVIAHHECVLSLPFLPNSVYLVTFYVHYSLCELFQVHTHTWLTFSLTYFVSIDACMCCGVSMSLSFMCRWLGFAPSASLLWQQRLVCLVCVCMWMCHAHVCVMFASIAYYSFNSVSFVFDPHKLVHHTCYSWLCWVYATPLTSDKGMSMW